MVSRESAEYAGHCGSCGVFGFPVRAKATHAALTLAARARVSGASPVVATDLPMLSNTNGISIACGVFMCGAPTGVSQSNRYRYTGARPRIAFLLASSLVYVPRG